MNQSKFEWGPLARGTYLAMICLMMLLGWVAPTWLIYYVPLLIFLGLGLRPLLEKTGLYDLFSRFLIKIEDARWRKPTEDRRREIERKLRDEKYKYRRRNDPKLPPNW